MGTGRDDPQGNDRTPSMPTIHSVAGDPRKFSAYVLAPGNASGKDRTFLGLFGFRPRSEEDADALLSSYLAQAQEKLARREYTLGERDEHGQRVTIEIDVKDRTVLSGWLLRPDSTLWLITPFSGFAR